jgi:hypothetical protein
MHHITSQSKLDFRTLSIRHASDVLFAARFIISLRVETNSFVSVAFVYGRRGG